MSTAPAAPKPKGPVVPESIIDVPSQRLYALSLGALFQAFKLWAFFQSLSPTSSTNTLGSLVQWTLSDALYLWLLPSLRIPRLTFSWKARAFQIFLFSLLNYGLFGNYTISTNQLVPPAFRGSLSWFDYDELAITEKRVKIQNVVDQRSHLLGQHTVRLSPISTAILNPYSTPYCLSLPHMAVFLPLLMNNTRPSLVQYSLAPLGDQASHQYINISARELRNIETSAKQILALPDPETDEDEDEEELDFFSEDRPPQQPRILTGHPSYPHHTKLQKTQILSYIRISRPGIVRLERVLDSTGSDVRITHTESTIVQCPTAKFEDALSGKVVCDGESREVWLNVKGTAPMALRWHREVGGKKESFLVQGIEGSIHTDNLPLTQEVRIPLTLTFSQLGQHNYGLDSLSDGAGNSIDLTSLPSYSISRSLTVLRRSAVSFRGCGAGKTVSLLKGQEAHLTVALNQWDFLDEPWSVTVNLKSQLGKGWTKNFTTISDKKILSLPINEAGEYTIVGVAGKHCSGDILSPETCQVVEQPLPSATIEFSRIHECSVDVGISVVLVFHGTPPFTVYYTTKRNRETPKQLHQTFLTSRGSLTLQPERSGEYIYTFTHVADKNYKDVALRDSKGKPFSIEQVVHPVASAEFVGEENMNGRKILTSGCDGKTVDVSVDLRGTAPWNLEFQIVGPKGSETFRVPSVNTTRYTLHVPIPPDVDQAGGTFDVELVSVEDFAGCKRTLAVPGVTVNVKRAKPTVKFYGHDGKRQVITLEGDIARLPLRLTGDGPWDVAYRHEGDPNRLQRVRTQSANDQIVVKEAGLYSLVEVRDANCPGSVVPEASTYQVDWVPRPLVRLRASSGQQKKDGSFVRKAVCEGTEDHVDLELKGRPPFQITYSYLGEYNTGEYSRDHVTFSSIQSVTRLQMRTSEPGHHTYRVVHVGDAAYPIKDGSSIQGDSLRLEQDVLIRPSAFFKSNSRMSYCLNDPFVSRPSNPDDATVFLRGTPPFQVQLSIRNLASSEVKVERILIHKSEWKVDLPKYFFKTIGPHLVTIESIQDASGCPQAEGDLARQSVWVDVAETAAIVPFDRREDFCVGDTLHFQLEGTPPWRVQYRFNGKLTTATAKTSKFSRIAESPGVFEIASIAHQQNLCQTVVSDVRMQIRALPSVQVDHGKKVIEDIREGDQAEILFTFEGEPPFTFTYQRSELTSGKKLGKVLETHTVSGVTTREYSVFSALEGTWTVTFISDRYCRYPPALPDSKIEKV